MLWGIGICNPDAAGASGFEILIPPEHRDLNPDAPAASGFQIPIYQKTNKNMCKHIYKHSFSDILKILIAVNTCVSPWALKFLVLIIKVVAK